MTKALFDVRKITGVLALGFMLASLAMALPALRATIHPLACSHQACPYSGKCPKSAGDSCQPDCDANNICQDVQ